MKLFTSIFLISVSLAIFGNAAAQTLGSCQIFPSNNPWNVRVDSLPVDVAHSAAYINSVGGTIHVHPDFGSDTDYGIPWEAVNGSQSFVPVTWASDGYGQSDPGPMPVPPNARVEADDDSHVLIVDTTNHHLYELYQSVKDKNDNGWVATSTAIFGLDSNNYRPDGWTSCDAAGLPIFPGLVRLDECKAGVINHALRYTVPTTQQAWIFPARHHAGSQTDTNHMPMGTRMRLKASYNDSKDTGYAKVIITALKKYGIILADNGSAWYISGEWNPNWPDDDIGQLKTITGNDFEVVNTGYPIETDSKEYPTPVIPLPSNTAGISAPSLARDTALTGSANSTQILISNTGSTPVTIARYWLKYDTVFQIDDSLTHTIAAGKSDSVTVNFLPDVKGQAVDTLFISYADGNPQTTAIALVGWATKGVFQLSPNPLNFGSVEIGKSKIMTVTLTNLGDGELDLYVNSQGTNQDFSLTAIGPQKSPPFVLMPGDTETAMIMFAPTVVGPESATDSLAYDDDAIDQFDTNLLIVGVGLPASSVADARAESFDFTLFPNPSSGLVTVSVTGANGPSQIEITDAIGRSVFRETIQSGTENLDMSGLPNGEYFARVINSSGSSGQRIVLER